MFRPIHLSRSIKITDDLMIGLFLFVSQLPGARATHVAYAATGNTRRRPRHALGGEAAQVNKYKIEHI